MATLALVVTTLAGSGSAAADTLYQYKRGGKVWISNSCPYKSCKVVLRGPSSSRSSRPSGGSTYAAPPTSSVSPSTAGGPGEPLSPSQFDALITRASKRYQIPEALIRAVIRVESNFNPTAVSRAGAMGLMQLMPGTAREQGVTDRFDPEQNVMGGTRYLRWLANYFQGDVIKTIAGYHAGHNAVKTKGGIPYSATESYVKKVLSHYYRYKSSATTANARP
jgi:soluble lytic murein transglycosylase-like protein